MKVVGDGFRVIVEEDEERKTWNNKCQGGDERLRNKGKKIRRTN